MKNCREIGRQNRLKIISYLELLDYWADVKSISQATNMPCKTGVYCHCNNMVREGILESDKSEINGRLTWVYRVSRH